jgi:hypothetical protein
MNTKNYMSPKTSKEVEIETKTKWFYKELRHQYDEATNSLLTKFANYKIYCLTITNINPERFTSINDFLDDVSNIYDQIQSHIFPKGSRHRGSNPYRPILSFYLDIPGSKGSGYVGRQNLYRSSIGPIQNLHAHGFLLLNPDSKHRFIPKHEMRFGYCQVQFRPLDQSLIKDGIEYASKTVESSRLINIELSQAYLFFSKQRVAVTPEQLANFQIRPPAANTNIEECRRHSLYPLSASGSD